MATDKQIQANRLNATKSTGPRTEEGKATARLNAFKHGIFAEAHTIIGEDRPAFEALRDDFLDRFQPVGPDEEALVSNLINASWLLARFHRLETCAWDMRLQDPISNHPMVTAHYYAFKELEFLQRRTNSTNRQFHRDMELLLKLQAARKKLAAAAEPIREPHSAEPLVAEIGSVPANQKPPRNRPLADPPAAVHPFPPPPQPAKPAPIHPLNDPLAGIQ